MIQAKESGNPRIKGVADEKIEYPGQIKERVRSTATIQKMIRDVRYREFFLDGSVMRCSRKSTFNFSGI
jgi:hypothetical protein